MANTINIVMRRTLGGAVAILTFALLVGCNQPKEAPVPLKPSFSELDQLKSAAEKGDAGAQYKLAVRYEKGDGVSKNPEQSVLWLKKAATAGNAEAMVALGLKFRHGEGTKKSDEEAREWWTKASASGNGEASYYMATTYGSVVFGGGIPIGQADVLIWNKRQLQEQPIQFEKMLQWSERTKNQKPMTPESDYKQYLNWLEKAASQGYSNAATELGVLLLQGVQYPSVNGKGRGQRHEGAKYLLSPDAIRALSMLESSASKDQCEAQLILATLYEDGYHNIKRDPVRASNRWDSLDAHTDAKTSMCIGSWYFSSRDDDSDSRRIWRGKHLSRRDSNIVAAGWYRKAEEKGDILATERLASMYETGIGVPQNETRAFELTKKVAETGDHAAEFSLGRMYSLGKGVTKDYTQAVIWLTKAANAPKDDDISRITDSPAKAQNVLGASYEFGLGVEQDNVVAYAWYNISAGSGHDDAKKRLTVLEQKMTSEEVTEGQKLSSEWTPGKKIVRISQQGASSAKNGISSSNLKLYATGTGIYISSSGDILTAGHVVASCSQIRIPAQDKIGLNVVIDSANDLAVFKGAPPSNEVASISSTDDLKQGDEIVVFGFPLEGYLPRTGNITTGVVAALSGPANNSSLIQVTAPVQQGNSGGPVMDNYGRVVGVVVAKADAIKVAKLTGDIPQNVNFAIASRTVKSFLEANRVEYKSKSKFFVLAKSPSELADEARQFSVKLECWK